MAEFNIGSYGTNFNIDFFFDFFKIEGDGNEEERGLSVDELGESQADVSKSSAPLKHLGLSRPKKPKSRLPTRTAARLGNSQTASQESLDADADLSQGLDTFFHTTTMATNTGNLQVLHQPELIKMNLWSIKTLIHFKSIEKSYEIGSCGTNFNIGSYGANFNIGSYGTNFNICSYGTTFNIGSYGTNFNIGSYGDI